MRSGRALALALFLVSTMTLASGSLRAADAPSFQELEESLTCQCGCGLTVHSCNHLQCPSALPLRAEIREQMAAGKSKMDILAHFESKYGEKILSAPTTAGFNLLAWTTPFIAVLIGGLLIVSIARSWTVQRSVVAERVVPDPKSPAPSAHRDILDAELKKFDQ